MLMFLVLSQPALAHGPPTCATLEGAAQVECQRALDLTAAEARLAELGACNVGGKKKQAACVAEKGQVELKIAQLQPLPAEEEAPASRGLKMDKGPQNVNSLELDVGDE